MTDANKNILITPNVGVATVFPKIEFTGFDNNTLTLSVLDDGTLSIDGSAGQLFSVSDSLTGTIFSVNDISGIPSIEVIDDGTVIFAETAGNVGIGTATPAYALDVVGNINASEDVIAYSDKRLKENIFTYNDAMETVKKLRGVRFNKINNLKTSVGLIAQEVEAVLPEAVHINPDTGYLSVAYGNIVGVLVEALKEQDIMIKELTKRLDKIDGSD